MSGKRAALSTGWTGTGQFVLQDSTARRIMQSNINFVRGALGNDTFPDGSRVPTCAGW